MDIFVVHKPYQFKQDTTRIRGVFLPSAGPGMAGRSLPTMMNVLAAVGAVPGMFLEV